MKRYYINPEIKISSGILTAILIVFFIITAFIQMNNYESLRRGYIKNLGAIGARVVERSPGLEKEIIPLITKEPSKEEALKGKNFMEQYGLGENTEYTFFPYLNEVITHNNILMIILFLGLLIILFILNYFQYGFFYDKIRRLTKAAKKVVEGEYETSISEEKEGDLSKLSISFNSMREVIRNNIGELKSEKQFLIELLSDISHQLKTPLSSMIVYNDIMLSKELTKEQRETFLNNNKNQLHRMSWLIKQILKLAKLDAKAIVLNKENLSLNETILEAVDSLESKAIKGDVKINFNEKEEVFLSHDRLWMQEALSNIIKNSIEHTKTKGEINVELFENPVYVRVVLEDTGEGISEEDLPNIFKRFYKAKTSKKSDSIGIGLAISKSIVELHGGMIEVQSQISVGTKFIITFLKY